MWKCNYQRNIDGGAMCWQVSGHSVPVSVNLDLDSAFPDSSLASIRAFLPPLHEPRGIVLCSRGVAARRRT